MVSNVPSLRLAFALFVALALPVLADASVWVPGPLDDGGSPAGTNHIVRSSILWDRDGEGTEPPSLVIGGYFTDVAGVVANRVARLDPFTGQWQELGAGFTTAVLDLTIYEGELIAGISLGCYRWTGTSWQRLGGGTAGAVRALTVYNGELVAGGAFTSIGGQPYARIAKWNGTSWSALGSGLDQAVNSLGVHNGLLYVGGQFNNAGGNPSQGLAAWNGSSWLAIGTNGRVDEFTLHNGELIVAGNYSTIAGIAAHLVARTNGVSWFPMPGLSWGLYALDSALSVASVGDLYAGIALWQSDQTWEGRIVRWNGVAWIPTGEFDERVETLTNFNGELMAGGVFSTLDGNPMPHMARRLNGSWISFGGGNVTRVSALQPFRGAMVAGGVFNQTDALGRTASNVIGWNGLTTSIFGSGMNGEVFALEAFKYTGPFGDDELIAGGNFSIAGGVLANNIARWRVDPINAFPPPAWQPMGTGFNASVYSIERHGGSTYAAGAFTQSGATWLGRVGRWNPTSSAWEVLKYPGMGGPVYAIKSYNGSLYAGGNFHDAGYSITGSFARWDGTNWNPVGGYFVGTIYSLEVHDGVLVIGGEFPGFNNSPNISTWNGTNYVNLGIGGTNGAVRSLHSANGTLYVGGQFTTAFNVSVNGIAKYDAEGWQQPHGGTNGYVFAMSSIGTEVHAGGNFSTVSGNDFLHSPGWGRYSPSGSPWITQQPIAQSVAVSANVSLTSQAATGYASSLQWWRFGQPLVDGPSGFGSTISGATTPTLYLGNIATADAGEYRMVATSESGSSSSNTVLVTVDGVTDAPQLDAVASTAFHAIGPNPSPGARATLGFSLAHASEMSVRMHDVRGRLVARTELGLFAPGRHELLWNAERSGSSRVAAGVYFVSLEAAGERIGSKRLVIVK